MAKRKGARGAAGTAEWLDAAKTVPYPADLESRPMFAEYVRELRALGHRPLWSRFVSWFRSASESEVAESLAELRGKSERRARAEAEREEQEAWESQAFAAPSWPAAAGSAAGSLVWMWHGTSSVVASSVSSEGLLVDPPRRSWGDTSAGWVYLTDSPGWGPCGAASYALKAARELGGDPSVIRVIVPWDDTSPDPDDRDLPCARGQRVVPYNVPPAAIFEIDGRRVRGPIDLRYATAMGLLASLGLRTPSGTLGDLVRGRPRRHARAAAALP